MSRENSLAIDKVVDYITNADQFDLSSSYVIETRGFRYDQYGTMGIRDNGTKKRHPSYPSGKIAGCFSLYLPLENVEYEVIVVIDVLGNTRIFVNLESRWTELTKKYIVILSATPSVDSQVGTFSGIFEGYSGAASTIGVNELTGYIAVNFTGTNRGESAFVQNNTETSFTVTPKLGSGGLGWTSGQAIEFFRCTGILPDHVLGTAHGYEPLNGPRPHLRWIPLEAQQKSTLLYGSSANPPLRRNPIQIRKGYATVDGSISQITGATMWYQPDDLNGQRPIHLIRSQNFIGNDPTTEYNSELIGAQIVQATGLGKILGWFIDKAQLIPYHGTAGSAGTPVDSGTSGTIVIGEGVKVSYVSSIDTAGAYFSIYKYDTRCTITALYRSSNGVNYQESDPIANIYMSPSGAIGHPILTPTILLDLSLVNKTIGGFRVYWAVKRHDEINSDLGNWPDTADIYYQTQEVLIPGDNWAVSRADQFTHSLPLTPLTGARHSEITAGGSPTLLENIGHAMDLNRSYMSPLYGARAAREQSSVIAMAEDEHTIRLSAYDGFGVHQDDNFPDETLDNNNRIQTMAMSGRGMLLGFAIMDGRLYALRNREIEVIDLVTGHVDRRPCDFVAKDSLIGAGINDSPDGIGWAGESGIYILSAQGFAERKLNSKQLNLYNGTLLTNNGTPFITSEYRRNIKAGWCLWSAEMVFQVQAQKKDNSGTEFLLFCYSVESQRCRVRVAPSEVVQFALTSLGKMLWVCEDSILEYPLTSGVDGSLGANMFQDKVGYDGIDPGVGVETQMRINVGEVANLDPNIIIRNFILDFFGESDGDGGFEVNLYEGDETTPFQTLNYLPDGTDTVRLVKPLGEISDLQIEIKIPTDQVDSWKAMKIFQANLGYSKTERKGNS